jgi:hypothetical protein
MILSWAQRRSVSPAALAHQVGRDNEYLNGLRPGDIRPFAPLGFSMVAPQSFSVDGFMELIQQRGPLFVTRGFRLPGGGYQTSTHAIVVTGFDPAPTAARSKVSVNDPWQTGMTTFALPNSGSTQEWSYAAFVADAMEVPQRLFNDVIRRYGGAAVQRENPGLLTAMFVAHLSRKPHDD